MTPCSPFPRFASFLALIASAVILSLPSAAGAEGEWIRLFDGKSLDGWRAADRPRTWKVEDKCLVAQAPRSHLFYVGPVAGHDFRNFELEVEARTEPATDSGVFIHTRYGESGSPQQGYGVQIGNSPAAAPNPCESIRTGGLRGVRNIYKACVADGEWFRVRVRVAGNRISVWVNGLPTVDYLEPAEPARTRRHAGRVLSHGTIALQGHAPGGRVAYRSVRIRLLPADADPMAIPRASDAGYGVELSPLDRFAAAGIPVIDYHVHLRGGMTVEKAIDRQAVTGINLGVLKNIGAGWPIETDEQLREFIESARRKPVFVGLQVNDRDWHRKHSPELIGQLDFILADTMIMPMPDDQSPPVKLWLTDGYTIDDPEAWMERYIRHNLRVLAEPITILANPTYLPPPVDKLYDRLWTDERMRQVIQAAVDNRVALEINAQSGLPHDRFIRMAKALGARFTFGANNSDDKPIAFTRCFEAIDRYGLTKDKMYVPDGK
ncbi:MAG: DUF1080 domain-containing protein [Pirellulales bacterium]|nr:DUF1080 domain-containing protein [Thermoguttaceae bacterium]MDD4788189.1 DUF1080 domain-containing protein [Pirellulales bacterium]NLZ01635.1 DUF1080 domain-containing protein [Pirellulaceae bacterium]